MDSEWKSYDAPKPPNRMQMFVFALIVFSSLLRLGSQDSGPLFWINIALLVVGSVGLVAAWLKPSLFARKR